MISDPELDKDVARRRRCLPSVLFSTSLSEKIEQARAPVTIERLQKLRELGQNKRVVREQKLSELFTFLREPRQGS